MNLDGLLEALVAAWVLVDVGFLAVRIWVGRSRRRRGWSS
jgi:hypothetical protein